MKQAQNTSKLSLSTLAKAMGLAVGLSLTLTGCGSDESAPVAQEANTQVIKANVQTVDLGTVPLIATVPGSVVPDQRARIASRLTGYIKGLEVQVGQSIKRGDLLFSIDSGDIRSQIAQANSVYQQASAGLQDAKLDFDRFSKLYKDDTVSKQQFDKVRLQYSVAQQNLAAAKSGLEQARAQLNYANVTAPFDGVIVEKLAVAGDLATPGNPIVVIENMASLSVQTEVAQDLFAALRTGDEAQVIIDGQATAFVGSIYTLVSSANPKTRTHTVKLSLPVLGSVNSGTFARVSFKAGERQAIMVPKAAVVNRVGVEGVFVLENNKAFFHMVRTGLAMGDLVEIQSGLGLGERIVIDNNESMLNGDTVEVEGEAQKPSPVATTEGA
ncbi:efflux RND transporter periplasmic adaptor subunit [Thiomicrorhabdus aquaedulcis]|uniref:efflux RND transporter periplasmic adaptor subunit n=1 Tax=Thiomicrorhabdus aquaedulcis TaxID=2211106 RepID=UPI000FDAF9AD|nr:efflux RND transporter periplasmic adaptor subunit [Thiomicrorhabdus aquaedulcis]